VKLDDRLDETDRRIRGWWPAAAVLAFVGVVVLSLGHDVNPGSELMDRLAHAAAYALLTAVVLLTRGRRGPGGRPSTIVLASCLVAFGTAMELARPPSTGTRRWWTGWPTRSAWCSLRRSTASWGDPRPASLPFQDRDLIRTLIRY
jgi:drug/metabolite transporter (DMT)-like permease